MTNTLERAINELQEPEASLFRELCASHDYSCHPRKVQFTIRFRGKKVGGLNRQTREWYLSKVVLENHGGRVAAERQGFRQREKQGESPHIWWGLRGPGAPTNFRDALVEITGVPLG